MSDAYVPSGPAALPVSRSVARPRSRFADLAAPRWFPAAAAGAGLVAALLLVDSDAGLGLTLSIAVAAAALLPAVRVERADWPLVAVGAALTLMPTLRAAEWLVALDVLVVLAIGCVAVVGGRDWRSVLAAPLSVAARVFPAPGFLARALPSGRHYTPLLRGGAIGAALLLVFGALFASADAAFAKLVAGALPDAGLLPFRLITVAVVALGLAAGVVAHHAPVALPLADEPRRLRGVEWVLPLVALDLLFATFLGVQAAMLFGGEDYVLRTAGLTYAEYGRSGFFQLLAVNALSFGVVAGVVRWGPPGRLSRALTGALLALNAVVLVSALRRLSLYESVYGLSVDRVLAHTIALWLGVVLVLVVVAGLTRRASWLPRAVVGSGAATLLLLNAVNPEALIARSLADRYARSGNVDTAYLASLSADATAEVAKLPVAVRECVLPYHYAGGDSWAEYNVARSRARDLVPAPDPARGRAVC